MKICLISKYPPIEGGISSGTYWLARELGERGHEVHVVTNALEVEPEFREALDIRDPDYAPKNVFIHSTDPAPTIEANPSHIPFSKAYCEKLASLAIQVVEEHDIDIIDSWYLLPYGVSGYLAKSFTNVPQVIRHGGSDLQRIFPSPYLNTLLGKVVKNADAIITDDTKIAFFREMGIPKSRIYPMPKIPVDIRAFNPGVLAMDLTSFASILKSRPDIPVIGYIGKITYHFETKGLCELLDACGKIDEDFLLLFVANGKKLEQFRQLVRDTDLEKKSIFLNFVPPWQVPSLLKACTCVVALEKENSPVLNFHIPSLPSEALATGRCVLMSNALHGKVPFSYLVDGRDALILDPGNPLEMKNQLSKVIANPGLAAEIGDNGSKAIITHEDFNGYLDKTVKIYGSTIARKNF